MKKACWLLAIVGAVLLSAAPVLADGDFYVIAGGGPPVGTKITSLPLTISNPGFYYLTGNLTYSGAEPPITVSSDNVTIDLMGFRLKGLGGASDTAGILASGQNNVEVRNGCLDGWYIGFAGFNTGSCHRAVNLRAENCWYAIDIENMNGGNLVHGCSVTGGTTAINLYSGVATGNAVANCSYGFAGNGTISGNSVINCSVYGIYCVGASSIIGNTILNPSGGTATGIAIFTSAPTLVTQNTVSGDGTHFLAGAGTVNVTLTNAGF